MSLGLHGLVVPELAACTAAPTRATASPCPHRLWGRGGCGWRLAGAARSGAGLGFGNLRPEQSFLSGENGLFPLVPLVGEGPLVGPGNNQAIRRRRSGGEQVGREQNLGRHVFSPSYGEGVTKAVPHATQGVSP